MVVQPSTQRCSECGFVKQGEDKITLQGNKKHHTKHNEYICYNCGSILDRDENAAINILKEGLKILSRNTVGSAGDDKSSKPADTGLKTNLEQESVIASGLTTRHAEKINCL